MKSKILWWILGALGGLFILSSLAITLVEHNRFTHREVRFPEGSLIGGIPVGGLDEAGAAKQLSDVYNLPLVLEIDQATLHVNRDALGFELDLPTMVSQAVDQIHNDSFWDYLWGRLHPQPVNVPLTASIDEDQILNYLYREIIPRYLQPGSLIRPIPGTTNFMPSQSGEQLDLDAALEDIQDALLSDTLQPVRLQIIEDAGSAANPQVLEAFLRYQIDWMGFDELVEVYLEPMETESITHFAIQNGLPVEPGVAFTAASTIKIPIMISVLRQTPEPTPEAATTLLEQMIVFSENPPADTLMSTFLDEVRGPLIVSEDLAALGMANTFLAGYFYLGAPVLQLFDTPANARIDINLDPDIYNQTIPAEAGQLLSAIYTCAKDSSGLLTETFPGEISQSECQLMVDILSANRIGLLIEAGLPPEARAAHKHGWVVELDGLIHSMSDVAIVFSPAEDYVLTIFIYDPDRLDFDAGNRLIARLSQTVYNFFNIENQAYWWFD